MPRRTDAREKAVRTAGKLFQEQGYAATGLIQIIEQSGSPKGSFYFHFPGGKEQLAIEALTAAGENMTEVLRNLADRCDDPARLIRSYVALQAETLENSDYRQGCPIATLALEMAAESEPIRAAADAALSAWSSVLANYLRQHGHPPAAARRLGQHILATLEGALLLARTQRSTAPLRSATKTLAALVTTPPD